jgi:hypothetical protein
MGGTIMSVFMIMLRAIGTLLFDLHEFVIRGYYSSTHIAYYKKRNRDVTSLL